MKQFIFLLVIFAFCNTSLYSQTPFTTLVKEPRFLKKSLASGKMLGLNKNDKSKVDNYFATNDSTLNGDSVIERSIKNDFDFFRNNSLSLNLLSTGENRASINSQVLYYKLYVANPNDSNTYRLNRYNIPLMLISKLSTNYDSLSASSAIDVLDYEAAPITVRIMPSFRKAFHTYNDVIYWGFYTDLRGINLSNPQAGSNDIEFVGTAGFGFTYQGDGSAGTYNTNGEYESGRYSISLIFQTATARKEVISRLFATDENYVTSLQGYLVFKVSEKSKLNFKCGFQHFFQKTLGGLKNNFSLSIAM